jgi:predicted Co/Zn/Cd cation transporter (cation efflux family)
MTVTASPTADPKVPSFDRRIAYGCLGMAFGLVMGLLLWCFDLVADAHYPVVSVTVSLMAIEGMIGFLVAQRDKGKFEDLLTFIVAFFFVP